MKKDGVSFFDNTLDNCMFQKCNLVSIIIPVYKVDKYLNKCLDSVVNQSYRNLDIILINDGSPDHCPIICDEWAQKDSRIRVFHQENQGVSAARNVGLQNMHGDYFTCIDPDDYWHVDYIKNLLTVLQESKADLSFCGLFNINSKNKIVKKIARPKEVLCGNDIKKSVWGNYGYVVGSVCKMFKTRIVQNNHLTYTNGLKNGEDWIFLNDYLNYCKKTVHCGESLYYCLIRDESASSNVSRDCFSHTRLELWNSINKDFFFKKKYDPWINRCLEIANDIVLDSIRHKEVAIKEIHTIKKFIKNYRFSFLLKAKMPAVKKAWYTFKYFFPSIVVWKR